MLERVLAAPGLAPLLDDVLSVESVGVFKPDARVYRFAATQLGVEPSEIAFQTANAWDAAGAATAGLTVHWINRDQAPDEYGLRGSVSELPSLAALSPSLGTGNPTLIPLLDEAGIPFDSLTVEERRHAEGIRLSH